MSNLNKNTNENSLDQSGNILKKEACDFFDSKKEKYIKLYGESAAKEILIATYLANVGFEKADKYKFRIKELENQLIKTKAEYKFYVKSMVNTHNRQEEILYQHQLACEILNAENKVWQERFDTLNESHMQVVNKLKDLENKMSEILTYIGSTPISDFTQRKIAEIIGKSETWVSRIINKNKKD